MYLMNLDESCCLLDVYPLKARQGVLHKSLLLSRSQRMYARETARLITIHQMHSSSHRDVHHGSSLCAGDRRAELGSLDSFNFDTVRARREATTRPLLTWTAF